MSMPGPEEAPPAWTSPPPPPAAREPTRGARVFAAALVAVSLLYVVALPLAFLVAQLRAGGGAEPEITAEALVATLLLNLLVMGGTPLLVVGALAPDREAVRRRLFLRAERAPAATLLGAGVAVVALLALAAVVSVVEAFTDLETNDLVRDLGRQLTWPLVLFVAAVSAVSEELYFRAFLMPRIGLVASSVLFGLVHVTYGTWLQVIAPMLLGVVFGVLVMRTGTLLAPIAAHFTWNFVQLAAALLAAREGDAVASAAVLGV